jgi:hypothetical protein
VFIKSGLTGSQGRMPHPFAFHRKGWPSHLSPQRVHHLYRPVTLLPC